MGHHYITEIKQEQFTFESKSKILIIALFVIGAILTGIGAMNVKNNWDHTGHHADTEQEGHSSDLHDAQDHTENSSHEAEETHHVDAHQKSWLSRFWANMLLNSYYFLLIAAAATFFIAVNYMANAGWAVLAKRVMEAVSSYLIVGSILLLAVLYLSGHHLYHWIAYFHHGFTPKDDGYDKILESKSWLLNSSTWYILLPIVFAAWITFRMIFRNNSKKEDNETKEGALMTFRKSTRWSAGFLFVFAFSFSLISWMVMMSIDAHWYSTMFSIYNFAIAFVSGLTVITMFVLYLKHKGYLEVLSDEVIHDLGKFMFAFCVFWGYIFLGQWLLIWYANIPEETVYYLARLQGQYQPLFFINIFLCFLFPFLTLMMRNAKRNPIILSAAAAMILVGHWIDLYLLIMPGAVGEKAGFGMLEIGTTMAFTGLFLFIVMTSLTRAGLITIKHPYVLESANHDVGP